MNKFWMMTPLFSVLAAVSLYPQRLAAQGHGGAGTIHLQIRVDVRLEESPAPAGVIVDLEYGDGVPFAHSETDSGGRVMFTPDTPTIWIVRAKQPGYKEATARLDLQNTTSAYTILTLRRDPQYVPPDAGKGGGTAVSAIDLSVPEPARKEYDAGQHALENHDLDGGIAHLRKAIEIHDQFPQAYTLLGMAYNEQKKWKDAQGALEKAVQLDPKAVEAYFQLGAALNQQKDFAGAAKALNQGLQLNPDAPSAPTAHYQLAFATFSQGNWKEAEPHAAKTIAAQPDFPLAHWLMAQIMLKKGDGQGAIHEFETYLKLDPNGPMAPSVRAVIPKIQAVMQKK